MFASELDAVRQTKHYHLSGFFHVLPRMIGSYPADALFARPVIVGEGEHDAGSHLKVLACIGKHEYGLVLPFADGLAVKSILELTILPHQHKMTILQ